MGDWPDGWSSTSLADAASWMSGGTPRTDEPSYWNGDIPWITSGSLTEWRLKHSDRRLTPLGVENGSRIVPPGTVIFVVRGMSLKTEFRIGIADRPLAFGQDCKALRAVDGIDDLYLAYAIKAQTAFILDLVDEAGHGTGRLNTDQIKAVRVGLPPLAEQRAIAGVLGALDDKIESNRRIAVTCESLSWVLLEAELGNSSEVVPLGDLARFRNSERKPLSALQRAEMSGARVYPYFGATGVFDYVDDYLFDDLTALVGEDGSVVNGDGSPVVRLAWGKYWVNNHAHVLVGKSIATELLYVALKRSDVRPLVTGAVQAKVSMGNLRTLGLKLPAAAARAALGDEIRLILGRMRRALDETAVLEETRDALLPELLSGRLRVREAEEMVGSV